MRKVKYRTEIGRDSGVILDQGLNLSGFRNEVKEWDKGHTWIPGRAFQAEGKAPVTPLRPEHVNVAEEE